MRVIRLSFPVLLASLVLSLAWSGAHAQAPGGEQNAGAPRFVFPAGCEIGRDCWFFAYMDHDSSDAYRDHMCGLRTYNTHKGTDIAPVDPAVPLAVIAAADGVVLGVRDGMDDTPMRGHDETRMAAQCGNGVRLGHGNGWTSQYCHLQRDSVSVRNGDRVTAGQILGWVGSSGRSELPHLHFQVEHDGRPVDPFSGAVPSQPPRCDASGVSEDALWNPVEAREIAAYAPSVIYRAGVATDVPDRERATFEGYPAVASVEAEALVGYVVLLGINAGTTLDTLITGPDGERVFENRRTLDENRARFFGFAGTRRKRPAWAPGDYAVRFVVTGEGPAGTFSTEVTRRIVLE